MRTVPTKRTMDKGERSPAARQRAEAALVRLVWELRDDDPFLVVLGGLVPLVLAEGEQGVIPEHLGTTDIDILLITHVDTDVDLGTVERALARLELAPTDNAGWRWRGVVDGSPAIVEFLCDLPERREGAAAAGRCRGHRPALLHRHRPVDPRVVRQRARAVADSVILTRGRALVFFNASDLDHALFGAWRTTLEPWFTRPKTSGAWPSMF